MEIIAIMLLGAILNGLLASSRGRSPPGWALLGAFFPLISLLILVLMPDLKERAPDIIITEPTSKRAVESAEKTCPQCAEAVKEAARICRFCGFQFVEARPLARPEPKSGTYHGVAYQVMPDGTIRASINGHEYAWDKLADFTWNIDIEKGYLPPNGKKPQKGVYRDVPFETMPDGTIRATINGQEYAWNKLSDFKWDLDDQRP